MKFVSAFSSFLLTLVCVLVSAASAIAQTAGQVPVWTRYEATFTSSKNYSNPLYELDRFVVQFTSPTGRTRKINGFWDGGTTWKVRFCPDEKGPWTYQTVCSDTTNMGLHRQQGSFVSTPPVSKLPIYAKGGLIHPAGTFHLAHADGTPFFWLACTAWNGPLKSTEHDWKLYLEDRAKNGFSVIQVVMTQFRGADKNRLGQVAFEGSGRISLNVDFFKFMDQKIDQINEHGLVAAPALLWALPSIRGRELSPGYYLPEQEAIKLARYMVARYGGNHVVWMLGGDGQYDKELEQRWRTIGRGVFGDEHPGLVTTHPQGGSWIGDLYQNEDWMDLIGYQSSHSKFEKTVNWINQGPMARGWDKLRPRPIINLEPNYEQINDGIITDRDVRNASYWSLFATPLAGITYGANGIWPWLQEGEDPLNHRASKGTWGWKRSLNLPGSRQMAYLGTFLRKFDWWTLKPAPQLLAEQPGKAVYNRFISVVKSDNDATILAYVPVRSTVKLYNDREKKYQAQWFNPATNQYQKGKVNVAANGLLEITSPTDEDWILILTGS